MCLESQHLGSEGRRIILRELEFNLGSIRLCLSSERGTGVGKEDMGTIASALNTLLTPQTIRCNDNPGRAYTVLGVKSNLHRDLKEGEVLG